LYRRLAIGLRRVLLYARRLASGRLGCASHSVSSSGKFARDTWRELIEVDTTANHGYQVISKISSWHAHLGDDFLLIKVRERLRCQNCRSGKSW
jgi:hypothetical protein